MNSTLSWEPAKRIQHERKKCGRRKILTCVVVALQVCCDSFSVKRESYWISLLPGLSHLASMWWWCEFQHNTSYTPLQVFQVWVSYFTAFPKAFGCGPKLHSFIRTHHTQVPVRCIRQTEWDYCSGSICGVPLLCLCRRRWNVFRETLIVLPTVSKWKGLSDFRFLLGARDQFAPKRANSLSIAILNFFIRCKPCSVWLILAVIVVVVVAAYSRRT